MGTWDQTVSVTWMGTAGVLISDGNTGILIDPYVTRCGFFKIALNRPLQPEIQLVDRWLKRLGKHHIKAVAVTHSHFDHCLDAPYFARNTGAPLMGSESTLNVGRGAGLSEDCLQIVRHDQTRDIGDFSVRFIESIHGPAFLGRVPYPGTIDKPLVGPRPAGDYKLGQTFAIRISHPCGTIVHHGSAGFIPGMYNATKADVVLLGIVGRGDTQTYLKNIPLQLGAKLLIPIHFDNFFVPLAKKMKVMPTAHFREFIATAQKYHNDFALRLLTIGEKTSVLPLKRS